MVFNSAVDFLILRLDRDQLGKLLDGDTPSGLPSDVARPDAGKHGLGLTGGDIAFRLSRQQFCEQSLEPIDSLDPPASQCFTAIGEHPQRLEFTVELQHSQGRCAHSNGGDRVGVVGVGLAVVAGVEEPHLGGELAGTSTTCSPSSRSRCASGRPAPLLPSTAHTRFGQVLA
jgi:hypothetical protein